MLGAHARTLLRATPDWDMQTWHLPQVDPKSGGLLMQPYIFPEMGVWSRSVSVWWMGCLPGSHRGSHMGGWVTQQPHTCQGLAGWRWGCHGLSLGAQLPERQEPLPGPPPEIRWAENAKNRDSEMPSRQEAGGPLAMGRPQQTPRRTPHPRPERTWSGPHVGLSTGDAQSCPSGRKKRRRNRREGGEPTREGLPQGGHGESEAGPERLLDEAP